MSAFDLSVLFFLQAAVILLACRVSGWLFVRLGQPQVVAEMIAGVLLGPSLLGLLAPQVSAYLFPPESKPILFAVAQLGLVLYMFLVGLEFDWGLIQSRLGSAAAVSFAGIGVPFVLGSALAYALVSPWLAGSGGGQGMPGLFSAKTTTAQAMLFLGAAMSITAFPMLARIISERGLSGTSLGTLALAAGATDDAVAWCVLAVVLASFQNEPSIALLAIGGGIAFAWLSLQFLRPALRRFGVPVERSGKLGPNTLVGVLVLLMLGAWFTDYIQIYAVFGAFVIGMTIPRGQFAAQVDAAIRPLTVALLLPFFFVYSGLHTKIGLIDTAALWALAALVLLLATIGKGVACYAAARWSGEPHHDALAIGTLMNARGLMELIILNIGLQRGVIEPALFAVMVLMAIATTLMATPVFNWVARRKLQAGLGAM